MTKLQVLYCKRKKHMHEVWVKAHWLQTDKDNQSFGSNWESHMDRRMDGTTKEWRALSINPHTNIEKTGVFEYVGSARTPTAYWYTAQKGWQFSYRDNEMKRNSNMWNCTVFLIITPSKLQHNLQCNEMTVVWKLWLCSKQNLLFISTCSFSRQLS